MASSRVLTMICAAVALGATGSAWTEPNSGDWPQFRGATRDGRAVGNSLASTWPAEGLKPVWRHQIGEGFASPAVVGSRVYTATSDSEKEYAVALDAETGKELWRQPIGPLFVQEEFGSGTRATPTLDGPLLFIVSGTAQLHALQAEDGKVVWSVDLLKDLGSQQPRFGYSPSPLVVGELLLVEAGGSEGRGIVAFDKKTGTVKWHTSEGAASYSSPIAIEVGGETQIVFTRRASPEITALRLDGSVAWSHPGFPAGLAMPVPVPPDRLFFSSTNDGAGFLLRLKRDGDKTVVEEVWRNNLMKNHFSASVVVGDLLFGFDNATFKCLDVTTGQQKWASRGYGKGSLIAADKWLYVLTDDGRLALVEATGEAFREKAIFQAMTGKAWTPPTLAGHRIFLRDQDEIVCYDARG